MDYQVLDFSLHVNPKELKRVLQESLDAAAPGADTILKGYTRLALINTGRYELEHHCDYGQRMAARFGLRYEEIPGSNIWHGSHRLEMRRLAP